MKKKRKNKTIVLHDCNNAEIYVEVKNILNFESLLEYNEYTNTIVYTRNWPDVYVKETVQEIRKLME